MRTLPSFAALMAACILGAPAPAQLMTRGGGAVALTSQTVHATLRDGLADVSVRQVFRHEGAGDVEAVYQFPLPAGAALTGLVLTMNGVRSEATLADRCVARRVYDEVVSARRDPALLEQVADGAFRLSVFPVSSGVDTVVELAYLERAPLLDGAYRLTLPLGGEHARGATTTATVEVLAVRGVGEVSASLASADIRHVDSTRALVSYERGPGSQGPAPDGLGVSASLVATTPTLDVAVHRDSKGDAWFVAVVAPGAHDEAAVLPRDVLLVLDTSGSMQGAKLAQAKAAARDLIAGLADEDRVNIVRFSSDVSPVLPELALATPANRELLLAALEGFVAKGSTALGDALAFAAQHAPAGERVRTVVLLTDGRPTIGEVRPEALVASARNLGEAGLRLFTFGVGTDVDDALLRGVALAGRGYAEVFDNPLELEARLARFLSRTRAPALRELTFQAKGVTIADAHPRVLPDAYFGEEVVFAGRLVGDGPAEFAVAAQSAAGPWARRSVVVVPLEPHGDGALAKSYAMARLADLEEAERVRRGLSDEAFRTAAEVWRDVDRGRYSTHDELVGELVATSLQYGVQCAYTSFLALEERDRHRLQVAQADPFQDQAFGAEVIGIGGGGGGRFGGRSGGKRNLRAAGGSGTEQVVQDGLEWLKRELEAPRGTWSLRAEAMAMLAFVGDGHFDQEGTYGGASLALAARLRARFDATTGRFADAGTTDWPDAELDQLLATLALTDLYAHRLSPLVRKAANDALAALSTRLAADEARRALSPEALGVALQLLEAAAAAGLEVGDLDLVRDEVARREQAGEGGWLVALAALSLEGEAARRATSAERLVDQALSATHAVADFPSALRLWLASDSLHAAGGAAWTRFDLHRKAVTVDSQRRDGEFKGCWEVRASSDTAGTAPVTAACVLVLEASYR